MFAPIVDDLFTVLKKVLKYGTIWVPDTLIWDIYPADQALFGSGSALKNILDPEHARRLHLLGSCAGLQAPR
jgi:hypothetical protein